jgi:hypothetical protein
MRVVTLNAPALGLARVCFGGYGLTFDLMLGAYRQMVRGTLGNGHSGKSNTDDVGPSALIQGY